MTKQEVIELFDDFKKYVYDKCENCDDYLFVSKLVDDYLYDEEVQE